MMENMTNDVMNEVVVSEAKGVNVKDVAVKAGTVALGALAGFVIYKAARFFMGKAFKKDEPEVAQGQPGPMGPMGPKGDTPSKEEIKEVVKEVFAENKTKGKEKTTETKAEDKAETKAEDKTEHQDK